MKRIPHLPSQRSGIHSCWICSLHHVRRKPSDISSRTALTAIPGTGSTQVGCLRHSVVAWADASRLYAVLSVQTIGYFRKYTGDRMGFKAFVSNATLSGGEVSQSIQVAMTFLLATAQQALMAMIGELGLPSCITICRLLHDAAWQQASPIAANLHRLPYT